MVLSLIIAAMALAACGGDDEEDTGGGGGGSADTGSTNLTIYSSLPLQGGSRPNALSVNNGAKMALKRLAPGGKLGKFNITFKALDDSTAQAGKWEPGQTQRNARRAVQDKSAIAYLGEFNSGATAISLPILNQAGILQVSPANTAVGLTSDEPGAAPGEPDKYYPTGKRTYGRVVPNDIVQGGALASLMKEDGCTKAYIVNDKEVYGAGLSKVSEAALKKVGVEVLGNEGYDPKASNYRSLAGKIKSSGADCFLGSLIIDNNAVQLWKDIHAAAPTLKMYGPDGVADPTFHDPKEGGISAEVAKVTKVTVGVLDPAEYPEEGQQFFKDYEAEYGEPPEPYGIYGYEAMAAVLTAIKAAGDKGNDRQAVIDAFFGIKGRKSVLGTYDIDENGDTTLTDYGAYTVEDGELKFAKAVQAAE